jgi:hypothetical protein
MTHFHEVARGLRGFAGFSSPMADAQSEFGTHGHAIHCKYCSGLTKEKILQNPAEPRSCPLADDFVRPNRGITPSHPTNVTCEVTISYRTTGARPRRRRNSADQELRARISHRRAGVGCKGAEYSLAERGG